MSEIHEFIPVDVPCDRVPEFAGRFVASHRRDDGDAIVPLRLQVGDLTVERDMRLSIVPVRHNPGCEVMDIRWHAAGGGAYPAFQGTLSSKDEGRAFCRLELDGGYEPPGSVAGVAFDAAVGNRIAQAVARTLIEDLKAQFEQYAAEVITS